MLILVFMYFNIVDAMFNGLMELWLSSTNVEIPHFFCELNQIIRLACSDTIISNIMVHFLFALLGGSSLFGIIYSYTRIFSSVLKMPLADRKYKAFSTCGSHLLVLFLSYGTGFVVYINSPIMETYRKTAEASVMLLCGPSNDEPLHL
jgi:olfactory receptor